MTSYSVKPELLHIISLIPLLLTKKPYVKRSPTVAITKKVSSLNMHITWNTEKIGSTTSSKSNLTQWIIKYRIKQKTNTSYVLHSLGKARILIPEITALNRCFTKLSQCQIYYSFSYILQWGLCNLLIMTVIDKKFNIPVTKFCTLCYYMKIMLIL